MQNSGRVDIYQDDMSIKGYVMDIQPFSVNDGNGIRSTIFIAGCPLRCQWCSNPEGFVRHELIGWHHRKCIGCGECVKTCPEVIDIDLNAERSKCTACGKCTESCPTGARTYMVRLMDADDVLKEIQTHRLFYTQSGGGITFSGGEATSQPEFLKYLADNIYDMGYSMAIETSGIFDWGVPVGSAAEEMTGNYDAEKKMQQSSPVVAADEMIGNCEIDQNICVAAQRSSDGLQTGDNAAQKSNIVSVLEKMDMIFMDLKFIDEERHIEYTGVSNKKILANIARLKELDAEVVIRIPVIGGANDDEDNIRRSASYVHEYLPDARMELLPYHEFGMIKYEAMGIDYDKPEFSRPTKEKMEHLKKIVSEEGVQIADFR